MYVYFLLFGLVVLGNRDVVTTAELLPPCPGVTIDFAGLDTVYCFANGATFPLTAVANNGSGGSFAWSGDGVTGNDFSPFQAGPGVHWIQLVYSEANGCTVADSLRVRVYEIPSTGIVVTPREICAGDTATINYTEDLPPGTTYNWSFDDGIPLTNTNNDTVTVQWLNSGNFPINLTITGPGCANPVMVSRGLIRVSEPIPAANPVCGDFTINSLTFDWDQLPDVVAYRYRLPGQSPVFTSGNSLMLNGLLPGDSVTLELTPLGSSACGNGPTDSITCATEACPDFTIDFSTIPSTLCLDSSMAPIPLIPMVMGGSGINSSQTWSGPGVRRDTFFPALVGSGSYWLVLDYQEKGPCGIIDSTLINVYRVEAGVFELDPNQICFGDTATVNYIGDAADDALFDWDFGNIDTLGNNLRGDIGLVFPAPGFYPVELTITEIGCRTFPTTLVDSIRVVAPLTEVGLRCGAATRNTLLFEWDNQAAATAYLLQQPGGNPFARTDTFFQLANLQPGATRTLVVTPLGQFPCGDGPPDTISCTTSVCPIIALDLSNIPTEICNYRDVQPINLVASQLGGNGTGGGFSWSGNGVIGNTFDPQLAGTGDHLIRVLYSEEGICSASDSLLIRVFAVPEADLMVNRSELCLLDSTLITFAGQAGPAATFSWDFDGGTILSGSGRGPYLVSWPDPGTYDVNVSVTENNCNSLDNGQVDIVEVVAPLDDLTLRCGENSLSTLSFNWQELPDVERYQVIRTDNNASVIQQNNQFSITGLQPGQSVELVVVPLAINLCGNGGADTLTCTTQPCPPLNFSFGEFPKEFCFGAGPDSIRLPNDFINGDEQGRFSWSGTGVRFDGSNYFFSPLFAGVGTFPITATYFLRDSLDFTGARFCSIDSSVLMRVYPAPIANAGPDQTITCQSTSATLNGSLSSSLDAFSYAWTTNDPAITIVSPREPIIETEASGNYLLTVTTARGCTDTDAVTVRIATTPPVPEIEVFDVGCFGEQNGIISVIGFNGGLPPYQVFVDGFPATGTFFPDLRAGQYELEIVDANNCRTIQLVTIQEPEPLTVRIAANDDLSAIPVGTTVNLVGNISGGSTIDSIYWLPSDIGTANFNRLTLEVTEERNVEINVVDEAGCRASDRVSLSISVPDPVFVPSGFSPNGDNNNDLFVIGANTDLVDEIEELAIYNRWGNLMFRVRNFPPNDPRFGWDGTAAGERLNPDVFVYYAIIRLVTGEKVVVEGGITLVK